MISRLLIFLKRKPGMSVAEFRNYYENRHIPLCMKYMRRLKLYRRHYLELPSGEVEMDFDVITELGFADAKTRDLVLDTLARDAMPADVIADEAYFLDRTRSRAVAVTGCETTV
jgi:EthD domain